MLEIKQRSLTDDSISKPQDQTFVYGEEIVLDGNFVHNGYTLQEGTDYTISDISGIKDVKDGGYTVTYTGKNNYKGEYSINVTILPRELTQSMLKNYKDEYNFNGQELMPEFTVQYPDGRNLIQGENNDYIIKYYSDNELKNEAIPKNAGKYYAKITGKGNFTGNITFEFEIIATEPNVNPLSHSPCSLASMAQAMVLAVEMVSMPSSSSV